MSLKQYSDLHITGLDAYRNSVLEDIGNMQQINIEEAIIAAIDAVLKEIEYKI